MTYNAIIVCFVLAILAMIWHWHRYRDNARNLPLPPGPPPLPLVGNLFNMPSKDSAWVAFGALSEKYGDIMHFRIGKQHIIVISSLEAATELFEKRGTTYSDRFLSVMLGDLMETGWAFSMISYNEEWRQKRKIFHQYLGSNVSQEYGSLEAEQVTEYLRRLRDTPEKSFDHSRFVFAAILMDVIYGIKITDAENRHVREAEAWVEGFNQGIEPGRFWVDFLPFLKYIPEWFPGAEFKRLVAGWRRNMYNCRDGPFDEAKGAYVAGSARPCAVTRVLEDVPEYAGTAGYDHESLARDSFGVSFGAGVDTSAPTMQFFYYLMLTHPDVQKRAQAELQAIVGPDRLPALKDRERLPFTESVWKETLRLHPATPLALPHYTNRSDTYKGYYIPKHSVVIGNTWQILHDPSLYPNPHAFDPMRYLNSDGTLSPDVLDPTVTCFGFGRRICPGRFIAMDSLFLAMAGTLHAFNIVPALDSGGKPVVVELRMHAGSISHPEHFACDFKLRPGAEILLE